MAPIGRSGEPATRPSDLQWAGNDSESEPDGSWRAEATYDARRWRPSSYSGRLIPTEGARRQSRLIMRLQPERGSPWAQRSGTSMRCSPRTNDPLRFSRHPAIHRLKYRDEYGTFTSRVKEGDTTRLRHDRAKRDRALTRHRRSASAFPAMGPRLGIRRRYLTEASRDQQYITETR